LDKNGGWTRKKDACHCSVADGIVLVVLGDICEGCLVRDARYRGPANETALVVIGEADKGGGTSAAKRAMTASGSSSMEDVQSDHGFWISCSQIESLC
jgi:hypothetical protein